MWLIRSPQFVSLHKVYTCIRYHCLSMFNSCNKTPKDKTKKQKNNDNVLWNWITFLPWNFGFLSIPCSLTAPFKKKKFLTNYSNVEINGENEQANKALFTTFEEVFFLFDFQFFWPKVSAFFNTFKTLISYVSARTYLSSVCFGHKRMVFMYGSENVYALIDSPTTDRKNILESC